MTRIAFVGNIASMNFLIARELICRGYDVDLYASNNIFQSNHLTKHLFSKIYRFPFERRIREFAVRLSAKKYDIEIRSFESPLVTSEHKVVIFHGSDVRRGSVPIEYPCFYTTKDLVKYFNKEAVWLPRCADTIAFVKQPRRGKSDYIVAGHFPTDPIVKGTELVIKAVELLNKQAIRTRLLMERINHDNIAVKIAECDVICDWFNPAYGLYGVLSIESLLMDRPVVCHVKNENYDYSEMKDQIVNCEASPEAIAHSIVTAINRKIDTDLISRLYSPKQSTDVLLKALEHWGMLSL